MPQNLTIDINKLTTDELDQLAGIFYRMGDMRAAQTIYNRKAFQEGWLSPGAEEEYYNKYC